VHKQRYPKVHMNIGKDFSLECTGSDSTGDRKCLNNMILLTLSRLQKSCARAGKHDMVAMPEDLDAGGVWRN
jgi:hypothetical protein